MGTLATSFVVTFQQIKGLLGRMTAELAVDMNSHKHAYIPEKDLKCKILMN